MLRFKVLAMLLAGSLALTALVPAATAQVRGYGVAYGRYAHGATRGWVPGHYEVVERSVWVGGGTRRPPAQLDASSVVYLPDAVDVGTLRDRGIDCVAVPEAAGANAAWRLYPSVEHLAIVQVALPDVFAFFDEHAR